MDYQEFQSYCARMGFTDTPITRDQFDHCVEAGLSDEGIYGVACDVSADIEFNAAVSGNLYQETES
jgi:hypothetical protein